MGNVNRDTAAQCFQLDNTLESWLQECPIVTLHYILKGKNCNPAAFCKEGY